MTRSTMRSLTTIAACLAVGIVATIGTVALLAQSRRSESRDETVTGIIRDFVRNDHDDIDGFRLDSDVYVHFPPHIGGEVTASFDVDDRVTVDGHDDTLPQGEHVFKATRIAGKDRTIYVEPPDAPSRPRHQGPTDEPRMNAEGTVRELTANRHGDMDGFVLEDGTLVKFPPHQSRALQEFVSVGDRVSVAGRRHETPAGDIHLHADLITLASTGKTLERDESHHHRRPPRSGKIRQQDEGPGPEGHEEILRELREIRQLLESRFKR